MSPPPLQGASAVVHPRAPATLEGRQLCIYTARRLACFHALVLSMPNGRLWDAVVCLAEPSACFAPCPSGSSRAAVHVDRVPFAEHAIHLGASNCEGSAYLSLCAFPVASVQLEYFDRRCYNQPPAASVWMPSAGNVSGVTLCVIGLFTLHTCTFCLVPRK